MKLLVRKVDGKLMAELPDELIAKLGVVEGSEIDGAKLLEKGDDPAFAAALDAVIADHAGALRELAK